MKLKVLIDETLLLISELGIVLSKMPVSFWMIIVGILLIMLLVGIVKMVVFYRQNKDKDVIDWISYFQTKWHKNMFHLSRFIAPSLKTHFKQKDQELVKEGM